MLPIGQSAPRKSLLTSREVLQAYGLGETADDFLEQSPRVRLHRLRGSRSSDPEPLHLHKYRPLDVKSDASVNKVRQILVDNQVWMASPSSLNDKSDMRFDVEFNHDPAVRRAWLLRNQHLISDLPPQQLGVITQRILYGKLDADVLAAFQKEMLDRMGVFSGARDPRNDLMWTHYAGDSSGVCVQFSTWLDELFLLAKRVKYGDKFPKLILPVPNDRVPEEHYLVKASRWAYETEWRVVAASHSHPVVLRPESVSGVIVGSHAEAAAVDVVRGLLEERRIAGHPPVKVYRAVRSGFDIRLLSGFLP